MDKQRRSIYLPAKMLVSMYNLYAGNGEKNQMLNMNDVQLMCAYLEYYFNYVSNKNSDKYVYHFYTSPYYWVSNPNDPISTEMDLARDASGIFDKYAVPSADEKRKETEGELFKAYKELSNTKHKRAEEISKTEPNILDPTLDYPSRLPENPFEYGVALENLDKSLQLPFRAQELYKKEKATGEKYLSDGWCRAMSTFYILNQNASKKNLTVDQYIKADNEFNEFWKKYFKTGGYKFLATENYCKDDYAPNVNVFLKCLHNAIKSLKQLNPTKYNEKYYDLVNSYARNYCAYDVTIN